MQTDKWPGFIWCTIGMSCGQEKKEVSALRPVQAHGPEHACRWCPWDLALGGVDGFRNVMGGSIISSRTKGVISAQASWEGESSYLKTGSPRPSPLESTGINSRQGKGNT